MTSFSKLKSIVDLANKKGYFLSVDSVVHIFLLALSQVDLLKFNMFSLISFYLIYLYRKM